MCLCINTPSEVSRMVTSYLSPHDLLVEFNEEKEEVDFEYENRDDVETELFRNELAQFECMQDLRRSWGDYERVYM